jgi:hypothetical protein
VVEAVDMVDTQLHPVLDLEQAVQATTLVELTLVNLV